MIFRIVKELTRTNDEAHVAHIWLTSARTTRSNIFKEKVSYLNAK